MDECLLKLTTRSNSPTSPSPPSHEFQGRLPVSLIVWKLDDLVSVRDVKLLEDYGHLPGVGVAVVALESDGLERHVAGLV
jgi:hypothetical protein